MTALRRRFTAFEPRPELVRGIPDHHPAAVDGRSLFQKSVVSAQEAPRLLVSGEQQRKIGSRIMKGRWKGKPIYCLTLEERATCPRFCAHWATCYGNSMHWARRHQHGPELEYRLWQELKAKQSAHPAGFVVRVHVLGDFYDLAYASLWTRWLQEFPALHLMGFTAQNRWGLVGRLIDDMNLQYPDRVSIRFSTPTPDTTTGGWATTIWRKPEAPAVPEGIVCPAQTGRTDCCATCGLCWATEKTIVFIAHGNPQQRWPRTEK